jgi:hypothetical protein
MESNLPNIRRILFILGNIKDLRSGDRSHASLGRCGQCPVCGYRTHSVLCAPFLFFWPPHAYNAYNAYTACACAVCTCSQNLANAYVLYCEIARHLVESFRSVYFKFVSCFGFFDDLICRFYD